MKNIIKTAAAALIASIAVTSAASAQDADLNRQIAEASSTTEAKIFDLVMAKAQADISKDLAALNHTAPAATDRVLATSKEDDVVVAGVWF